MIGHLNPRLTSGVIQPIAGTGRQRIVLAIEFDGHPDAYAIRRLFADWLIRSGVDAGDTDRLSRRQEPAAR